MFEGDPASLSHVDAIAQTMLNALGLSGVRYPLQAVGLEYMCVLPALHLSWVAGVAQMLLAPSRPQDDPRSFGAVQAGRPAQALRRQLAKALTEAEYAHVRKKQVKDREQGSEDDSAQAGSEDDAGSADAYTATKPGRDSSSSGSSDSSGGNSDSSSSDELPAGETEGTPQEDLAVSVRNLLASIRAVQKEQADSAGDGAAGGAADGAAAPDQPAEPEEPRPSRQPQPLQPGSAGRRGGRSGGNRRQASHAEQSSRAAAAAGAANDKVYVDDETGDEFVLPEEVRCTSALNVCTARVFSLMYRPRAYPE